MQAGLRGPHRSCEGQHRSAAFQKKKLHLHKGQRLPCKAGWLKGSRGARVAEEQPQRLGCCRPVSKHGKLRYRGKKWYLNQRVCSFPACSSLCCLSTEHPPQGRDTREGLSPGLPSLCRVSPRWTSPGAGNDRILPGKATSAPGRCRCCSFVMGHTAAGMGTGPAGPEQTAAGAPAAFGGRRQRLCPWHVLGTCRELCPVPAPPKGHCDALQEVVPQQQACKRKKTCIPQVFQGAAAVWQEPCESGWQRATCTPVM